MFAHETTGGKHFGFTGRRDVNKPAVPLWLKKRDPFFSLDVDFLDEEKSSECFFTNVFNALFGRETRRELSIWQARIAQKLLSKIPQAGGWMGSSSPRRKCVTLKARDPFESREGVVDF